MFGVSPTELVIILALALLLLGPDQLPSVARTVGKALREFRSATDDIKASFERQMAEIERDIPATAPKALAAPDPSADTHASEESAS
jgi:sec-independent protein translocase protein TatB